MRNLIEVIDQMVALIPNDEDNAHLLAGLASAKVSAGCSAPELMGLRWRVTAEVLRCNLPEKLAEFTDWQKRVIEIFSTKTFPELLEEEGRLSRV